MKKLFKNVAYILLLIMIFTYMVIGKDFPVQSTYNYSYTYTESLSLLDVVSETGISVIGFLFLLPAIVFAILAFCLDKKMIIFCRAMFGLITGVFCFATGIIGIFYFFNYIYIPIILMAVAAGETALALVDVIKLLKNEGKE